MDRRRRKLRRLERRGRLIGPPSPSKASSQAPCPAPRRQGAFFCPSMRRQAGQATSQASKQADGKGFVRPRAEEQMAGEGTRQRPGLRRPSGASGRRSACGKLQRAGALQDAAATTLLRLHRYGSGVTTGLLASAMLGPEARHSLHQANHSFHQARHSFHAARHFVPYRLLRLPRRSVLARAGSGFFTRWPPPCFGHRKGFVCHGQNLFRHGLNPKNVNGGRQRA